MKKPHGEKHKHLNKYLPSRKGLGGGTSLLNLQFSNLESTTDLPVHGELIKGWLLLSLSTEPRDTVPAYMLLVIACTKIVSIDVHSAFLSRIHTFYILHD
jgi:hypothetical protein